MLTTNLLQLSDRPIHPELGTIEPESSEAVSLLLKQLAGEVATPMPEYVTELEQIKQSVAISLRPDQAYELVTGISKVILIEELDEEIFNLIGRYCLIHSAQVEGQELEQSLDGFKSLKLSPDFAPPGSILGYGVIDSTKKYTPELWVQDRQAGLHDHQEDLDVFKKLAGVTGDLYAVVVRKQMMLAEPVYGVKGGTKLFWSPGNPYDTASFRSAFEADRPVIDVDRESLEMALQQE